MNQSATNPVVRWAVLAGVVLAAGILASAGTRHALAEHWAGTSDPERWLRAAELEPSNPGNWYRLGRYRQLDFEHADLPMAISYYEHATMLNPASALYWMDLAGAYETNRDPVQAEKSLRIAQQAYPASGEVAWRFGNFLLRQGRTDEAFQQIRRALSADPSLTALAVSRCWRSTGDINRILNFALPPNADAYWGAIDFFVSAQEPGAAMAVWTRLAASGAAFPISKAFPLFEIMIQAGRVADAKKIWQQGLAIAGISQGEASPAPLIWNGGFEREILNGGFDWRYQPIDGGEVNFDMADAHGGQRSLRLVFDGKSNVNFQNVWQYVVVEPQTRYRFSAFIRSEDLTTDNGIRFLIQDATHPADSSRFKAEPAQFTANVIGTQPWTSNDIEFTTGSQTNLLRITLFRSPSDRLGNKISGSAWVDDVSLIPLPAAPVAGR